MIPYSMTGSRLSPQPNSSFGFPSQVSAVSRAPTKHYDRENHVIVVDSSDESLKFLKMHLNRFFSKVSVFGSGNDAYKALKDNGCHVMIIEGAPVKKSISDFLKKVGSKYRHIPVVMTRAEAAPPFTTGDYPALLVTDVVAKPFDMDTLHVAIRRAMNIREPLAELARLLDAEAAIGKVVRTAQLTDLSDRRQELVDDIRRLLTEDILD